MSARGTELLLERYLAGELSPEDTRALEARLHHEPALRDELEALRAAREAYFARHPPHELVAALRSASERPRGSWTRWVLGPAVGVATALGVTVLLVRATDRPALDAPPTDATVPIESARTPAQKEAEELDHEPPVAPPGAAAPAAKARPERGPRDLSARGERVGSGGAAKAQQHEVASPEEAREAKRMRAARSPSPPSATSRAVPAPAAADRAQEGATGAQPSAANAQVAVAASLWLDPEATRALRTTRIEAGSRLWGRVKGGERGYVIVGLLGPRGDVSPLYGEGQGARPDARGIFGPIALPSRVGRVTLVVVLGSGPLAVSSPLNQEDASRVSRQYYTLELHRDGAEVDR